MFKAIRFIALGLAVQGPVFAAAESYPAGPVTIVVPYAAGGLADNIARPIADALGRELKQPFIVENKGGAGAPAPRTRPAPLVAQIRGLQCGRSSLLEWDKELSPSLNLRSSLIIVGSP
ncbi:hypothetical protein E2I20_20045 [Alcaligenaceae bacterium SAGV3]|nr:hypothetical protein [Alcaligenaceae bacterium SAGV3]